MIEQCDFHAQGREHGRVLQANNAGAYDDQVARDFFQAVHLVGVEDSFAIDRNFVAVRGPGSAGDEDVVTAKQLRTLVVFDLKGVGIEKARITLHEVVT